MYGSERLVIARCVWERKECVCAGEVTWKRGVHALSFRGGRRDAKSGFTALTFIRCRCSSAVCC